MKKKFAEPTLLNLKRFLLLQHQLMMINNNCSLKIMRE
jgi:hypothetical protein